MASMTVAINRGGVSLLNQVRFFSRNISPGGSNSTAHLLGLFCCYTKLISQKFGLQLHHFVYSINDEIALSAWSTLFTAKSRTCGGTSIVIFGSDMSLSPPGSFPRSVPC
jgi:hypothetical protein